MFVYVISAGPRIQKIGLSRNVEGRLATLQTAHHSRLSLAGKFPVKDGAAAERYAHSLLSEKRLTGEWFDVSVAQALAAVKEAAKSIAAGKPHRWHASPLRVQPPSARPAFTLAECAAGADERGYFAPASIERAQHRRRLNDELYRRLVAPQAEK